MSTKSPAGCFTLLYFASASTFTRKTSEYIPAPLSASKLFEILEERYPGFYKKVLSSCAVTINLEYVDVERDPEDDTLEVDQIIQEGDEVAIIPPVSSG